VAVSAGNRVLQKKAAPRKQRSALSSGCHLNMHGGQKKKNRTAPPPWREMARSC
jgi:hypothetical protein